MESPTRPQRTWSGGGGDDDEFSAKFQRNCTALTTGIAALLVITRLIASAHAQVQVKGGQFIVSIRINIGRVAPEEQLTLLDDRSPQVCLSSRILCLGIPLRLILAVGENFWRDANHSSRF